MNICFNIKVIMHEKFVCKWKETVMAYFKDLSWSRISAFWKQNNILASV